MKSHNDVAKDFVNGETESKGSRVFIEGDSIFSYGHHFKIAQRYFKDGIDYLFNPQSYSKSTSCHQSYVRRYLQGVILEVMDCNINNAEKQYGMNKEEIMKSKKNIKRARKDWIKENYKYRIRLLLEQNKLLGLIAIKQRLLESIGKNN